MPVRLSFTARNQKILTNNLLCFNDVARWALWRERGGAEDQDIAALLDPGVAFGQRHHMGFADGENGAEVEGGESFTVRQTGFGHMASDTPGGAFGQLVVAHRGEETGTAPALAIGAGAKLLPDAADRRQAQSVQHHRQLGGVDVAHAASPRTGICSSSS